jgi:hypothetical protein
MTGYVDESGACHLAAAIKAGRDVRSARSAFDPFDEGADAVGHDHDTQYAVVVIHQSGANPRVFDRQIVHPSFWQTRNRALLHDGGEPEASRH